MTVHRHIPAAQRERPEKLLYTYEEAAYALGMTRGALRDLVYKGRGPVSVNIGRRVFFAKDDLVAFINKHRDGPLAYRRLPRSSLASSSARWSGRRFA